MTLYEMQKDVLKLIEESSDDANELTDDPDIKKKINTVINFLMYELSRIKPIIKKEIIEITEEKTYDLKKLDGFYKLKLLRFKDNDGIDKYVEIIDSLLEFSCEGEATIYYYKYPKRITDEVKSKEYTFELTEDVLHIMPYGVAGDILKSDPSNSYGQIYMNRYEELLSRLDPKFSDSSIFFENADMEMI